MAISLELPSNLRNERPDSVHQPATHIQIGSRVLDPDTLELTDGDRVEVLRPLPAALLFYLLRHRHRIVPKEELHRVLWPDTSVSDAALASAIRDLRRILDDDGETQEIVRTFRGRGYRFVAPVDFATSGPPAAPPRGEAPPPMCAHEFVGRERELARFDRVRTASGGGRGGTLLVESASGGGRSSFLAHCSHRTTGVLWLGVRCVDEPWVPRYDTVARVLIELESAVGSERVEDWVRHDPDIAFLLPDLLPREVAPAPRPRVEALAAALRRVLDRASQVAPVVVAIDDIHAIDRTSLELLCTGAARSALLVATADRGRLTGSSASGIDALFSERSRIRLAGLTSADISVLARSLPQAPGGDSKWAARVRERTGGHPADIQAVLDELATRADCKRRPTPLLPQAVFERVSRVIDGLSRPAQAILTAGAALPPGASTDLIKVLADCETMRTCTTDPVEECVRAGLMCLRVQPTRVELNGQFVRHVTLARVSPDRRRELEKRATEVLREVI